ncbi:MAG: hypothetical protein GY926_05975 [bacterium]|nr:hypothetical protein [bacterium]
MTPLEDRYRRLLAVYPAAYRGERADEMVATLMERSTGQQREWPTFGETADLCRGAAWVRVRANTIDPWGDVLKGVWWGAALWLVFVTLLSSMHVPWSLAILLTVVLALAGRRLPALIVALLVSAPFAGTLPFGFDGYGTFKFIVPLLVVAAIAPRTAGFARLAAYVAIGVAGLAFILDLVPGRYDISRFGVTAIAGLFVVWFLVAGILTGRVLGPIVAAALIAAGNAAVAVIYHGGDLYVWATVAVVGAVLARLARKRSTLPDQRPPIRSSHT